MDARSEWLLRGASADRPFPYSHLLSPHRRRYAAQAPPIAPGQRTHGTYGFGLLCSFGSGDLSKRERKQRNAVDSSGCLFASLFADVSTALLSVARTFSIFLSERYARTRAGTITSSINLRRMGDPISSWPHGAIEFDDLCHCLARRFPSASGKHSFGSRGKIQLRCRQGRRASALSQRHRVAPLIFATNPWARTSRRISDRESRESGKLQAMRQFTGQRLNLDDDAGGKRGRDARPEVATPGQEGARGQIVCATC